MSRDINKNSVFSYYLAAFMLMSTAPAFYVWHNVWYSIFIIFLFGIFLLYLVKQGVDSKTILAFFLFFVTYFIFIIRAGANIFGVVEILCLMPFFIVKKEAIRGVYDAFLKVYAMTMGIGLLFYFLVIWLGVSLPNTVIKPFNEFKTLTYHLYPFFVTHEDFFSPLSPRFMGLFDEPGVVGTISGILLLTERFNLKKWENVIVLLSGVFSFSLFFIIVCGLYVLIASPIKTKLVVVLLTIVIVILYYDNEFLYDNVFRRFTIEDGELAGMNREHGDFTMYFKQFRFSSDYWFGLGAGTGVKLNFGGSSYKQMIVDFGIIFFILYLACYYIYAFARIREVKVIMIYSVALLGTIYQRPFVAKPTLTFLLIASACILSDNNLNRDSKTTNSKN